jgi:hypothetical protein
LVEVDGDLVAGVLVEGAAQGGFDGQFVGAVAEAMKALVKGRPSIVPLTLTRPRVAKTSAEPSMTT